MHTPHAYVCRDIRMYMFVCMWVCVYVCACMCRHIHVCTYIHRGGCVCVLKAVLQSSTPKAFKPQSAVK